MAITRELLSGDDPVKMSSESPSFVSRVLWFAALWLAGVACVATVSYGIRYFIA